ncbi:MAG: universal stress protein [Acidimicrobiales bacterium]
MTSASVWDHAAELASAGIDFHALALRGSNVADALLQAAADERADLVVVGTRGLGGFTGLRIGGVALKVLHRTDRPVVLVPPACAYRRRSTSISRGRLPPARRRTR